jgi:hypothetical protein
MTDELERICKWNLPGRTEESHEILKIASVPAEIRTDHLQDEYSYDSPLNNKWEGNVVIYRKAV